MFNDHTTKKQRLGYGTPNDSSNPWTLMALIALVGILMGFAGYADLYARNLVN